MKHNKLVRDRIPAIIAASDRTAHTRLLTEEEYIAEALHASRLKKAGERGGFRDRILLTNVE